MEKEFVPKNESLELKELGFSEKCIAKYQKLSEGANYQLQYLQVPQDSNKLNTAISSPTFSQAFRFFREKYKIHTVVNLTIIDSWYFELYDLNDKRNAEIKTNQDEFETYKEAELECLKQLIKICKEQNT